MSTITIQAEDCLALAVKDYAEHMGKSLNAAVKDLLTSALALVHPSPRRTPSFLRCGGTLDSDAAAELRSAQADFSRVEAEM